MLHLVSFSIPFLVEENASVLSVQLYAAGTETTATSIRWALLYAALNPEIARKVQLEIDEQIGK